MPLLIHGLRGEAHAFVPLATAFGQHFWCLALTIRGRGQSDWGPSERYSLRQYAEDVRAFLGALGIARTHDVGTSMGGQIGMTLAATHPKVFLSCTLNDIGPQSEPDASARTQQYLATLPKRFPSFADLIAWEARWRPALHGQSLEALQEQYRWLVKYHADGSCQLFAP